jgi:hypothetical protein
MFNVPGTPGRWGNPMPPRPDPVPILDRWALLLPSGQRLLATPGAPTIVLTGEVHGDPRFPDGAAIVTSRVLELDPARRLARTRFSRYRLGTPSRLFRRWLRDNGGDLAAFTRTAPGADDPPSAATCDGRSGSMRGLAAED